MSDIHVESVTPMQRAAQNIRARLRNPPKPIADIGIDLKRKPLPKIPEMVFGPIVVRSLNDVAFGPVVTRCPPKCADIIKATAAHFDISRMQIMSIRRSDYLCRARHVAFYLCRTLTKRSMPEIGREMGGFDHTSVLHGARKIQGRIVAGDLAIIEAVDVLTAKLGATFD